MEKIIIAMLFLFALGYLGNMIRKNFSPASGGCAKGCGACGNIDFKKIEEEIAAKNQ